MDDAPLGDGIGGDDMEVLTAKMLRDASGSFNGRSGYTYDGIHPRHFTV